MALHLLKLAVGIASLAEFDERRAGLSRARGGSWVPTRNQPRRAAEVLDGGSLYWVIRGQIRARQQVTGFRSARTEGGGDLCLIEVDPRLVPTLWRPCRPFRGWRYLRPPDAPPDDAPAGELPPEPLRAELRALGLL